MDDDWKLQQALALSLQEFDSNNGAGPSEPSPAAAQTTKKPDDAKATTAAGEPQPKPSGQKRRRKLPSFNPNEVEIEACFRELDNGNKTYISVPDLIKASSKLGMDIDHQQAASMLEYITESKIPIAASSGGQIDLSVFKALVENFRVQ